MAEYVEVMMQRKRMCKTESDCTGCIIRKKADKDGIGCIDYIDEHLKEAEKIIMDWAKEHPIMTNADKFKEVFGFEISDTCPIDRCEFHGHCRECPHKDFWEQEYKSPKEKGND